jgi:acetyl-CoA C-acetyltransferase
VLGALTSQLAIVGVAQSSYRSAGHTGRRLEDLIFETCAAALKDASIARDQVDSIAIAASDFVDGRCISSMLTANAAGAYLNDEIKTADEGSFALIAAALRLMTGHFHTSLVAAWSKPSESPYAEGQNLASDPFYHRPFGLNHIIASALMAGAYRHRYPAVEEAAARVSVKNHTHGSSNPLLDGVHSVEIDEVLASPVIAHPLRKLEIAPEADGAGALVLTTAERARDLDVRPVFLRGLGWCSESYYLGERDLWRFGALEAAARRAYEQAGIGDPAHDLDLAEVCDVTAYHELLACEALGFCQPGEAGELARSGFTAMGGKLPVNPSGGCLSAYPVSSAGLARIAEACLQLQGRAEGRQVAGARTALAHGCTGYAGQSHSVFILSSEAQGDRG